MLLYELCRGVSEACEFLCKTASPFILHMLTEVLETRSRPSHKVAKALVRCKRNGDVHSGYHHDTRNQRGGSP